MGFSLIKEIIMWDFLHTKVQFFINSKFYIYMCSVIDIFLLNLNVLFSVQCIATLDVSLNKK